MCHFVSLFVAGAAFGEVHVSLFVVVVVLVVVVVVVVVVEVEGSLEV